jgi:hypothetical protein
MYRGLSRWVLGMTLVVLAVDARNQPTAPSPRVAEEKPLTDAVETQADASADRRDAVLPMATASAPLPRPPDRPRLDRREVVRMIDRLSREHGLEQPLVHSLVGAESAYDPYAVSPMGAVGLMQIMPATAADYGVNSVDLLFDPEINLRVGMRHLKRLLGKYRSIGHAVTAYNAGEGALERGNGVVTYPETQLYSYQVLGDYLAKKGIEPNTPEARLALGMDMPSDVMPAGLVMDREGPAADAPLNWEALGAMRSLELGQDSSGFDQADKPKPRLPPTRLSSRLNASSNSRLTSRLARPVRPPVDQGVRRMGLGRLSLTKR